MDKGLLGVMVAVAILFLIGMLMELVANYRMRKAARKLLRVRSMMDYELDRSARQQREANKARAAEVKKGSQA